MNFPKGKKISEQMNIFIYPIFVNQTFPVSPFGGLSLAMVEPIGREEIRGRE